jgi:TM2 domain-containing membrane protein YozV
MRKQYEREDLGKGVRGKYYAAYSKGTNLVLLSLDIAVVFPTAEAVDGTLRGLVEVVKESVRPTRSSGRGKKRRAALAWC